MKRNYLPGPKFVVEEVVGTENGGTAATNLSEARVNLGLTNRDRIGQPLGPIPIDPQTQKIPLSYFEDMISISVEVDGPSRMDIEDTATFTITNMDSRLSYFVDADYGTVSIDNGVITYTAPHLHDVDGGFFVNNKFYPVTLVGVERIPNRPIIISPQFDTIQNSSTFTMTYSGWSSNYPEDAFGDVEWQVSTSPDFSTGKPEEVVLQKSGDRLLISGVKPNTRLYVRVRHKGYYGYNSEWTPTKIFERPKEQAPQQPAILKPSLDGDIHETPIIFESSLFVGTEANDSFKKAEWQVSTSEGFTTGVTTVEKIQAHDYFMHSFEAVRDVPIFVRVRYTGTSDWTSDWSDVRRVKYVPMEPPVRPTITTPASDVVVGSTSFSLESSFFEGTAPDDHIQVAEWQRSTSPDFVSEPKIYTLSESDIYYRLTQTDLVRGVIYYYRVRFKGVSGFFSQWSMTRKLSYAIVRTPSVVYPAQEGTRVHKDISILSSDFELVGTTGQHSSSDWQISKQLNFSVLVKESLSSVSSKTDWLVQDLEYNQIYYVRVRHRSNVGLVSEWSTPVRFVTRAAEWDPIKIIDMNLPVQGASISVSDDGSYFAIANTVYRLDQAGPVVFRTFTDSEILDAAEDFIASNTKITRQVCVSPNGLVFDVIYTMITGSSVSTEPRSFLAYAKFERNGNLFTRVSHYVTANPVLEMEEQTGGGFLQSDNFVAEGFQNVASNINRYLVYRDNNGATLYVGAPKIDLKDEFVPNRGEDSFEVLALPPTINKDETVRIEQKEFLTPDRHFVRNGYFTSENSTSEINYHLLADTSATTPKVTQPREEDGSGNLGDIKPTGQWIKDDLTLMLSIQGGRLLGYSN